MTLIYSKVQGLGSSVSIVTTLFNGQLVFSSQQGQETFLLATASGMVLGPTQPASYPMVTGDSFTRGKADGV